MRIVRTIGFLLAASLALASPAAAQNLSSSSIDGVVTDQSGAALPGVTVTAASPALQVQQLTTVTDGQGLYRFLDLPRGSYHLHISGCEPEWDGITCASPCRNSYRTRQL